MRGGRARDEHRAAVAKRLALLGEEVAMLREPPSGAAPGSGEDAGEEPAGEAWPHTRVRPAAGESRPEESWTGESWPGEPVVAPTPPEPSFPRPGRHAARRRRRVPGVGLPAGELPGAGLPDRGLLGPAQLTVVAVAVALGLAVTCWWLLRTGSEPVPLAAQDASALITPASVPGAAPGSWAPSPTAGSATAGQPAATSLVVDVAGKVRRPGIAVLEPGARVVDAIEAAGGARRGVDLSSLNLARPLVDGEQILVGVPGGPQPAPAGNAPAGGLLVNINTAGQAELETLPEVGPVTAQAIIAWREQHGGFSSVDQLVEVDGIGEATLATVSPFVTV